MIELMRTIDDGTVRVLTFKAGLLSRVAHDLELTLEHFEIRVDGEQVAGRFWPTSLRVDGAVEHGELIRDRISAADKAEILVNVQNKILRTAQYPEVRLNARATPGLQGYRIDGELEILDVARPITFIVERRAGRLRGEVALSPERWGIAPFKAMFGAIKLQDRVLVRFDLVEPTIENA